VRRRPEASRSAKTVLEPDELATPSGGAQHRLPTGRALSVMGGATVVMQHPPTPSSTGASSSAKPHHLFVDPSRFASTLGASADHFAARFVVIILVAVYGSLVRTQSRIWFNRFIEFHCNMQMH
jgi:hypothetical protein